MTIFNNLPSLLPIQFHLFQKDTEEVITISSDESEEDMMPSESTLPEKLDEDERKQHNSSGKPKKNRKKRTLSESSDKDRLKKYPVSLQSCHFSETSINIPPDLV